MRQAFQSVNTTTTPSLGDILARTAELQPSAHAPATATRPRVSSARSRNRAAAWSYDLAKWRAYRLAMARSDSERREIERHYTELMTQGPDFTLYRTGSAYAEPVQNSLSKAQKQALLNAFDQIRAWLYRNSRKAHGQAVSRVYREILSVILSFAVKFGRAYPSLATIAKLACCSPRTVTTALAWLKLWGFLDWSRRLKRVAGPLGTRTRQTSNAYAVSADRLASIGAAVFFKSSDGNKSSPSLLHRLLSKLRVYQKTA